MKNRLHKEFENKIGDDKINLVELDMLNNGRNSLNETQRLPVKYSVGKDYLYTHRMYLFKKKYINGEISKDEYENIIKFIQGKLFESRHRFVKPRVSNIHDIEARRNKRYR